MNPILGQILGSIWDAWLWIWWIVLPVVLAVVLKDLWLRYVRTCFLKDINWITLEIKVPKDILQTPKAMEEVFSSVYSIYSYGLKFWDKWWDGQVEKWVSFEMVGRDGGIYFYVRTPDGTKNLIESSIYGKFPSVEIEEIEDYMKDLPEALPNKTYDLWGTEMTLIKDNPFPIKTHPRFEADIEERRIDPVASLAEVMSRLKQGEFVLLQFLVSPVGKPTDEDVVGGGKKVIDELINGKKDNKKQGPIGAFIEGVAEFIKNLVVAVWKEPEWSGGSEEKKDEKKKGLADLTKGDQDIIKGIEEKISKLNFETTIRVVYIDHKDSFSPLNISAIMGYFHQFNTQNMNGLKPNTKTMTVKGGLIAKVFKSYKKYVVEIKKRRIYRNYRDRIFGESNKLDNGEERSYFSTEELATLYHFPIMGVEAPSMRRLPSRKSEPPIGLPIK